MRERSFNPTPEQTLRALDRVSRGKVWDANPQTETWRHVADVAADLVYQFREAGE